MFLTFGIQKYLATKLLCLRVNFVEADDTRATSRHGRSNFVVAAKLLLDRTDNFLSSPVDPRVARWSERSLHHLRVNRVPGSSSDAIINLRGKGNTFISQLRDLFLPRKKICISEIDASFGWNRLPATS